jgi:hypothetical protein
VTKFSAPEIRRKLSGAAAKGSPSDMEDHSWTRFDGRLGGQTMVTLSNAVTLFFAEDVRIH